MNNFFSHSRRLAFGLPLALALLALPRGTAAQEQVAATPVEQQAPTQQTAPKPKEGKATLSITAELKTEGELARADAQANAGTAPDTDPEPASDPDPDFDAHEDADEDSDEGTHEIVSVGHDSTLEAGKKAATVVSVMGSSTSHGEVQDAVVSVMGDTHVTGPVGDAVVAVLGNVTLDSRIGGDAVAVLGNVELGPNADVGGQVVVIGGTLKRAPTARTRGGVEQVIGGHFDGFKWIRPWIKECLLLGRPLALAPGLGWAWALALAFLALYVFLALLFRGAMDRCIETFETQPGRTMLAALLSVMLSPVVMIVLAITIIGALLIPFVAIALFCAGLFGKAVILGTLGRRVTRFFGEGPLAHTAVAVLIGGVIVLGLYLIPVVGFIVSSLIGLLSLGVVLYTILLTIKSERAERAGRSGPSGTAAASAAGGASATYASSAAGMAGSAGTTGTGDAPGTPGTSGTSAMGADAAAPGPAAGSFAGAASTATVAALGEAVAYPRAGFMVRMGALAIDLILIAVCASLLDNIGDVWLLLLAIYGAVMWKLKGTTIGGIVCGLKVVRLDGRPLDWATSIVRALSCFLSLAIAGLGFFWIIFDDERQGWHDKIAGTVVVRVPKGVSLV